VQVLPIKKNPELQDWHEETNEDEQDEHAG
jgi:hypothetical protein